MWSILFYYILTYKTKQKSRLAYSTMGLVHNFNPTYLYTILIKQIYDSITQDNTSSFAIAIT